MNNNVPAEKPTRNNAESFQQSKRKPSNDEFPQKENQNKPYVHKDKIHFFKINEQHRLEKLRGTIEAAPDDKPIRLFIKNIPSFANEYDFEDKCEGLLNVVWNQAHQDCCNILIEDKYKALNVLNLESSLPKYCKEGNIFVNRAEENSRKQRTKATPARFENYHQMSNNRGFFIVENDIMKYFWYDQAGGFYDENGAYYNSAGKPQVPSYVLRAKQNNHQNNSNENKEKPSKIFNTNENQDFNENNNHKKQPKTEKTSNNNGNDAVNQQSIQINNNNNHNNNNNNSNNNASQENSSLDSNNTNNNTKQQPKKKQPKEKKNLDSQKQSSVIEKDNQLPQDNSQSPIIEYVNKDKEIDANKSNNNEKNNKQKPRKNKKPHDSSAVVNNQNGIDQYSANVVTEVKEIPLAKSEAASNIPVKSENDEKTNKQPKEGRTQGGLLLKQIGLIRQQQEHCRPQKSQGKENDLQENA